MDAGGFTGRDFDLFDIEDFPGRMAAIRQRIQPKLAALGEAVAPRMARVVEADVFPHVAKHARRTVNPPDDTWVAFGPERRGYKKSQHFKLAISRHCVRLLVELGPEFADKSRWAARWEQAAAQIHPVMRRARVAWFRNEHDEEPGADAAGLTPDAFRRLGEELTRRRDGHLVFGRRVEKGQAIHLTQDDLVLAAVETFTVLAPVYLLGAGRPAAR